MRKILISVALSAVALFPVFSAAVPEFRKFPLLPDLLSLETGGSVGLSSNYGWSMQSWERQRRNEILNYFTANEFGRRPVERPRSLKFTRIGDDVKVMGGKAVRRRIRVSYSGKGGEGSFKVVAYLPCTGKAVAPVLTLLDRDPELVFDGIAAKAVDWNWPVEKTLKRGYAALALNVNEIADDSPKCFSTGVFKVFGPFGGRKGDDWGAISAWAWGASRVMDWLVTDPDFDALHLIVAGRGARATAALWAGVTDERIRMVALKNSGCGGLKLNRHYSAGSELIAESVRTRAHHFCGNWAKWAGRDREVPYDQHQLLALMVPRYVKVGSDTGDASIGPESEFDCCVAASPIWWLFGATGLDIEVWPGEVDHCNFGGHIGHHQLTGRRGICRDDWCNLFDFADWNGFRGYYFPDAEPKNVPDVLTTFSGKKVTTKEEWEKVRRPEIMKFYGENIYGLAPCGRPADLAFAETEKPESVFAGRAVKRTVRCSFSGPGGRASFDIHSIIPVSEKPVPSFVMISISKGWKISDKTVDAIISRGYAIIYYYAAEYAPDMPQFSALRHDWWRRDVYAVLEREEDRTEKSWGAISAWAWGASRVMDWIETEKTLDASHVGLAGLSRCGKTALWAGAQDTRFAMVCPCCSGCMGSRLHRVDIPQREPFWLLFNVQRFWFCDNARQWAGRENEMPLDTHALVACIAPRIVVTSNGNADRGAGPQGDFYSAKLATSVWKLYGLGGIAQDEKFPARGGVTVGGGNVYFNYHVGGHMISTEDWIRFIEIADKHGWKEQKK